MAELRPPLLLLAAAAAGAAGCGLLSESDFPGARPTAGSAPWVDLGSATICLTPHLLGPADSPSTGLCVSPAAAPGAGCQVDRECRSRERCVCGTCTAQLCDAPGQCGPLECNFRTSTCGEPCSGQQPCPDGELCERGFCTLRCASAADCQTGEFCSSANRCEAAACQAPADCIQPGLECALERDPADLREPTLLDQPLLMFVELRPTASGGQIFRATTPDQGQSWRMDPAAPVLEPAAGERRVGAPSVIRVGDRLVLFFEQADGIGRAESSDGRSFLRDPSATLSADQPWEQGHIGSPGAAVLASGEVLLYYEGGDQAGIGLAVSADGIHFEKPGAQPVLTPAMVDDPVLWRQIDRLGQPFARAARDAAGREVVGLWFSARGLETSSEIQSGMPVPPVPNQSIGYAASLDGGRTFTPYPFNPVFDRVQQFVTHQQERTPAVAPLDDRFLLLYGAADALDHPTGIGVARSPR
jgi:hypothetical protein